MVRITEREIVRYFNALQIDGRVSREELSKIVLRYARSNNMIFDIVELRRLVNAILVEISQK